MRCNQIGPYFLELLVVRRRRGRGRLCHRGVALDRVAFVRGADCGADCRLDGCLDGGSLLLLLRNALRLQLSLKLLTRHVPCLTQRGGECLSLRHSSPFRRFGLQGRTPLKLGAELRHRGRLLGLCVE